MADKALTSLKGVVERLGLKKPWEITGIASTPDYIPYLPPATEYRKFAPGSQPVRAIVPHDVPQHIFDIKYFVRDYRRNSKYSARTVDLKGGLDISQMFAAAPLKPEDVKYTSRPSMVNDRGY